jgi:hypothetical protein
MSLPTIPPRQQIVDKINSYLQTNGNITAAEHKEIELLLVDAVYGAQIGDIKELAVAQSYINENFNMTGPNPGLGRATKPDGTPGERYGWAICNGLNNTVDKGGNVSVGYDPNDTDFINLTQPGTNPGTPGTKRHTLSVTEMPTHSHDIQFRRDSSGGGTGNYLTLSDTANSDEGAWGTEYGGNSTTGNARILDKGGNQAHNNMQPYIVTLFIQRIPTT